MRRGRKIKGMEGWERHRGKLERKKDEGNREKKGRLMRELKRMQW